MNIESIYFTGNMFSLNEYVKEFVQNGNEIISHSLVKLEPREDFVFFCFYRKKERIKTLASKHIDKSKLSEFTERMDRIFEQKLQKKTGWGRFELLRLYRDCVNQTLLEISQ